LQVGAQKRIRAKESTAEVHPQQAEARVRTDPIEFVVGNVEYLLVHEIAHLLISEKSIPIVGPVENAADYIATMALLREEPLDPTQRDRAERFLLAAATAFSASWEAGTSTGVKIPYWGEHALSIQRYYQIGCLLYGSDPAAFVRVPHAFGFSDERAQGCVAEYARASRAIDWVLQTYGRRPGDGPGAESEIVYETAPTVVSTSVVERLRSIELLERLIARLHERFTLDRPFRLVMRSCGRPEAAWMPDRRELAICYELIDTLYGLGLGATPLGVVPRSGHPTE
jgi:Putative metallopeptidase